MNMHNFPRRTVIKAGLIGGITSLSLPELLSLQAKSKSLNNKKSVIVVWMGGGPSHHETFDPKPEAPQPFKGHFDSISTNVDGILLPEHLIKCADCMDKWSIIRGLHHDNNNHSSAHEIMHSGYKAAAPNQQQNFYPSIGSTISEHSSSDLDIPPYVVIPNNNNGTRAGYLPHEYGPYETKSRPSSSTDYKDSSYSLDSSLTINRVSDRGGLLKEFDNFRSILDNSGMSTSIDEFNDKAKSVLTSGRAARAFDISKEPESTKSMYGSGFGLDLLLARRLVENGVKMVTVKTPFSWDTHSNSGKSMGERNLPLFDAAFSGLINDLHSRGMSKDVMVVAWGEFGRTPKINANGGRDHWSRSMSAAIAGGKVQGGRVVGQSDKTGSEPVSGITPPDVLATIYDHMGINVKRSYEDHGGRPHPILNSGEVLKDLF